MRVASLLSAIIVSAALSTAKAQDGCPQEKLVIGSGSPGGTYAILFSSMANVCEMVCESRQTQGGWDNITQMMVRKFDGGIAQVDLLDFLSRTEPLIKRQVRSLVSLHGSHLHILTPVAGVKVPVERKSMFPWGGPDHQVVPIRTLTDLKGRRIAAWQSAVITATIVDERLKLGLEIIEVKTRAEGFRMLQAGEVAAFMAMGGKPTDWIEGGTNVKAEVDPKVFTLVGADKTDIEKLGQPYYSEQLTYRSLNVHGLRLISVRNELVINNIQKGPMLPSVAAFKACFAKNLDIIKESKGHHPSWQDVSLDAPLYWEAYKPPQ